MVEENSLKPDPVIVLENVHKYYGKTHVLRGVCLKINKGEIVTIVGPSGSGKSTFLRIINHLEDIQSGSVLVNGIAVKKNKHLKTIRQKVGLVAQDYQLFPHLTIRNNITLAPRKVYHWHLEKSNAIADKLMQQLGIFQHADKFPDQLSGGEQQRVCIARTLAMQPEIILFDEPTSALDPARIAEVSKIIKDLAATGLTIMIVTHTEEVTKIADRTLVLEDGKIVYAPP